MNYTILAQYISTIIPTPKKPPRDLISWGTLAHLVTLNRSNHGTRA